MTMSSQSGCESTFFSETKINTKGMISTEMDFLKL